MSTSSSKPPIKHNPLLGLLNGTRWLLNPVSQEGVKHLYLFIFRMGRGSFKGMVREMKAHSSGRQLLDKRTDLGATLDDLPALGTMPEGSLGKSYFDFATSPKALPGYLISGIMHMDDAYERADWPNDSKYVFSRIANSHDLIHMLSGYGADLASEAININFTIGLTKNVLLRPFTVFFALVSALALRPTVGLGPWMKAMEEGYRRGRATADRYPLYCIPFEDMLQLPVEEVRQRLGVPPLEDPSLAPETWLKTGLAQGFATGFGAMDEAYRKAAYARAIVEAGVSVRDLMRSDEQTQEHLRNLVEAGAKPEEFLRVVRAA